MEKETYDKLTLIVAILMVALVMGCLILGSIILNPKSTGKIVNDNLGSQRLYCDGYIPTGWTYTFSILRENKIPQEELNEICEWEIRRK